MPQLPKSLFIPVTDFTMWYKRILKTISTLNQLVRRTFKKKAKRQMPLDDRAPCFYPLAGEEEQQVAQLVALLDSQGDVSPILADPPGWQVLGWHGSILQLRKQPQQTSSEPVTPTEQISKGGGTLGGTTLRPAPFSTQQPFPAADCGDSPTTSGSTTPSLGLEEPASPTSPRTNSSHLTPIKSTPQRPTVVTPPPLSTTPLTPEALLLLLDTFDAALSHTHYAVCGHSALAVWGYRGGMPAHVSIVCPAEDREVILTWARAAGWWVYPPPHASAAAAAGGEVIGVSVPGLQGVWGFRLRAVREVWGALEMARPVEVCGGGGDAGAGRDGVVRTKARVMAVPSLLDEFGRAWYSCVVRGRGGGEGRGESIAELILWLLRWVGEGGEGAKGKGRWKLTPKNVPCLVYGRFWDAFVDGYPDALGLLARCGLHHPAGSLRARQDG